MKRLLLFVVVSTLLTFGALAQNSASRLAPVSVHKSTKSERHGLIMENGKPIGFFDRVSQKRVNFAGEDLTPNKTVPKTKLSVITKESAKEDVATITLTVIGDPWGNGTGVQLLLDEDAEMVDDFWGWYLADENLFYIHSEYKIPENASYTFTNPQVILDGTASIDIPGGIYDFIFFRPWPMLEMLCVLNWAGTGEYAMGDDFLFLPGFEYTFTVESAGDVSFETPEDIALSNIILPQPSLDLTNQEVITVVLYNNGIVDITGDVELAYKVNGGTEVIEIYTISELVPGDEITYTFNAKADFSEVGFHTVEARVEYEFDSNPYNNTITGQTKKLAIIELPFIDEFDTPASMLKWSTIDGNGDGYSWIYDDWFLTDADGGKGCLQVLCQTYGADEYLITDPIAIPEAGTYNMSFYAARLGNDKITILYGTTFNVEEMEVLEVVTPNLYNWEKIELNVEIETSGNYFFAFHYYAVHSAGGAGINFDKFRLETQVSEQDYKPFPTSNAMWRESSGGFQGGCEEYQYLITGDIIINGLTYHKLQKSGIRYPAAAWGSCTHDFEWPINYYAGCFRNDIAAQKVYYIDPGKDTERVIYDFSLSVGDTIPELPEDFYNPNNTIKSIDSIEIGGRYHKRFKIDNNCWDVYTLYIIEGIGSTYGLLSSTLCPFESMYELICFSINEETIYPYAGYDCKPAIYNAIEDYNKSMINLYPNPTTGELRIESGELRINSVEIFDVFGRKQKTILHSPFSILHSIDISHLSNGIYFLKIHTESGIVVKKVVKE